jgi:hypothetical protein
MWQETHKVVEVLRLGGRCCDASGTQLEEQALAALLEQRRRNMMSNRTRAKFGLFLLPELGIDYQGSFVPKRGLERTLDSEVGLQRFAKLCFL